MDPVYYLKIQRLISAYKQPTRLNLIIEKINKYNTFKDKFFYVVTMSSGLFNISPDSIFKNC